MAQGAASNAAMALRQWEDVNGVLRPTDDAHFRLDKAKNDALFSEKPWRRDPKYFNRVFMSSVALVKILMHARSGKGKQGVISSDANNWIEVMGLLQGGLRDRTFVITDSFAIPVDATEVECAMTDSSIMYMLGYLDMCREMNRGDSASIGWYHSHPGYSAYLSGTDVNTQTNYQTHQDPTIALVVDPVKSISTGKAEIKAFRTYPEGYTDPHSSGFDVEGVPLSRIEESGFHAARYYEVPITVFRSRSDAHILNLLWNKYWSQTLAASPLVSNRVFMDTRLETLANRLAKAEQMVSLNGTGQAFRTPHRNYVAITTLQSSGQKGGQGAAGQSTALASAAAAAASDKPASGKVDPVLAASRASAATVNEVLSGVLGMLVKDAVFNDHKGAH